MSELRSLFHDDTPVSAAVDRRILAAVEAVNGAPVASNAGLATGNPDTVMVAARVQGAGQTATIQVWGFMKFAGLWVPVGLTFDITNATDDNEIYDWNGYDRFYAEVTAVAGGGKVDLWAGKRFK